MVYRYPPEVILYLRPNINWITLWHLAYCYRLGILNSMARFHQAYNQMCQDHKALLHKFELIHNQYSLEPQKYQDQFNQTGQRVVDIITEYENKLCAHTEKGQYAKYSHTLADKFHDLVRERFPKIDDVGIEVEYVNPTKLRPAARKPVQPTKPKSILDQSVDDILNDALNSLKKTNL